MGTAEVAADGTFEMELPNFSADKVASEDSTGEIELASESVDRSPTGNPPKLVVRICSGLSCTSECRVAGVERTFFAQVSLTTYGARGRSGLL